MRELFSVCFFFSFESLEIINKLFTGWGSVRMVKNCILKTSSQFFTKLTSQLANNIYIYIYWFTSIHVLDSIQATRILIPFGKWLAFWFLFSPTKSVFAWDRFINLWTERSVFLIQCKGCIETKFSRCPSQEFAGFTIICQFHHLKLNWNRAFSKTTSQFYFLFTVRWYHCFCNALPSFIWYSSLFSQSNIYFFI